MERTVRRKLPVTVESSGATIIKAGNMSVGVNLIVELTRKIAEALDEDFDIEVLEMHHKHKVDAPSGTALMLGQAAADGRGIDLNSRSVRVRDGITAFPAMLEHDYDLELASGTVAASGTLGILIPPSIMLR